jgi:hypothetical protein
MSNEEKEHNMMKEELERFRTSFEMLLEHSRDRDIKVDQMVARVDEMYKVFNNGTFLVTVVKWFFGLLLAAGGAYLMFKNIFYGQN